MNLKTLELSGLESNLGRKDDGQVSHGLNLVLKLDRAASMPLLLARIRQAQRKINAGLGELNFVHFARFLPTYDNAALQVITEFDGPLAPYVLDFAIEIGDVFDLLLSHTQGAGGIVPIAEHAAEFLAFVETHNTVTVPPIPPIADWPLFAAYPEQTVLDITGARSDLPVPKSDRLATPVERDDVQANILRGYRAERVRHFVLRVLDAPRARTWLAGKASADEPSTGSAKPDLLLNIGLTHAGMQALGIRTSWLAPFPAAFTQGPVARAKDNFDIDGNAPESWWLGDPTQAPDIHVVVSLYHQAGAQASFDAQALALTGSLSGGGLKLLAAHDAVYNGGKSWFGYADGIANPRIASTCPVPGEHKDLQPAASAGEFVLGAEYKNIYGGPSLGALPAALATNGSFCAIRVLAQDTQSFDDFLHAEALQLNVAPEWLAAKLMGRWYEGAPLSLHPDMPPAVPAENVRNDFDYAPSYEYPGTLVDHAGARCPVGAHIRRSNPRTARVAGARYARRLMRRGMHYELKDPQGQRLEVGLFGMFICADLERQFEFIQRQWINGDRFAAGLRGTRDPFIGTPRDEDHAFEIPMPNGPSLRLRLPQFVFTKGSLYLFMPGLKALSGLDRFATFDPPVVAPATPQRAPASRASVIAAALKKLHAVLSASGAKLSEADLLAIAKASVGNPTAAPAQTPAVSLQNLRFDPRRRDFQINPYPVYAGFRARERVHYSPLYQGWFVFGYDNVVQVCKEDYNFSAARQNSTGPRGLFTLDPPEHTLVRQRVKDAWDLAATDTNIFVTRSINRALAEIATRSCFDLVDDFARPVPRDVYFDILGARAIGPSKRLRLDALARKVMKHHDHTLDEVQQWDGTVAALELSIRLATMLATALLPIPAYRGSFLAHLARKVDWRGGPFPPAVAVLTLVNLTVAGYMSVEFLLASGIRRLLLDPAAGWNRVKGDLSCLPLFLREMRRAEHALSVVDRFAKQDVVLKNSGMPDVTIPQGASVFGVLASANRDERIFGADADTFNPDRPRPPPHLGLGYGTHECMGRALENFITEPAIGRLVTELPGLHLQSDAQPPWFENFYFRSFDHLAVTLK